MPAGDRTTVSKRMFESWDLGQGPRADRSRLRWGAASAGEPLAAPASVLMARLSWG